MIYFLCMLSGIHKTANIVSEKMKRYVLVEEIHHDEDLKRVSYGIACYNDSNTLTKTQHSISDNRAKVEALIQSFNQNDLSPIHFCDHFDDFLPN